jgi:L-seryl-tRNA(Ser) seleniumtransferase
VDAVRERTRAEVGDLPSVDSVMLQPRIAALSGSTGRALVVAAARAHLEALRAAARAGTLDHESLELGAIAAAVAERVAHAQRPRLRPVFNLTGTVLHTNFGRAVLPATAINAVLAALATPVALEYDLVGGRRGERDQLITDLLAELTGAESATLVNNNAAALLLVLSALAARRDVLVSRGELVEIGGSFRLPEIMRAAGARLVEVGTTNRTHLVDYEQALTPRTALVLKVHPSNYVISGFTATVDTEPLAALARARGIPLAVDLGSGALVDLAAYGLPPEPVVKDAVRAGADLVTFSGDKLLGGPQAGLIVGRAALLQRLNRSPLKRAVRVGKLTIAALEAVLRLYQTPDGLAAQLPTLRLLTRTAEEIKRQALRLVAPIGARVAPAWTVVAEPLESEVGSGAQPGATLASFGLAIRRPAGARRPGLADLARRLRALPRPVIGRVAEDTLWLDLRCLEEPDEGQFVEQLAQLPP